MLISNWSSLTGEHCEIYSVTKIKWPLWQCCSHTHKAGSGLKILLSTKITKFYTHCVKTLEYAMKI